MKDPVVYLSPDYHNATKVVASIMKQTMTQFVEQAINERMKKIATKDKIVSSIIDKIEVK